MPYKPTAERFKIAKQSFFAWSDRPHAPDQLIQKLGMIYAVYRLLMAIFLLLANNVMGDNIEQLWRTVIFVHNYDEYWVLFTYIALGFILFLLMVIYKAYLNKQLFAGFVIDMLVFTLLMYVGGTKDLQMIALFMVTTAASFAMLTFGQAFIIALIAVLSLVCQQLYFLIANQERFLSLSDTLLLCVSLVIIGLLSWMISKRMASFEIQAQQNAKEVARLNALNQEVIKNMVHGVIVLDRGSDKILTINKTAKQLLRITHISCRNQEEAMFNIEQQLTQYSGLVHWYRQDNRLPFVLTLPQKDDQPTNKLRITQKKLVNETIYHDHTSQPNEPLFNEPYHDKLLIIEDIGREESHAQQLKLASLGQLSASIAHEIRNPLAIISSSVELLKLDAEDTHGLEELPASVAQKMQQMQDLCTMVYDGVHRVNRIVEDVMRLSRQELPMQETVLLKVWLPNFLKHYYHNKPIYLKITQAFKIEFDPNHLEQILTNLLDNALRHTITIPNYPDVILYVHHDEDHVIIDTLDNGPGVALEHLPCLFNPFFTKSDKGTGLGLYLSKAFSEANHARLLYIPGHRKTCFRLLIPKSD